MLADPQQLLYHYHPAPGPPRLGTEPVLYLPPTCTVCSLIEFWCASFVRLPPGCQVRVNLWDLAGSPDYSEVRNEFYKEAQVRLFLQRCA